MPTEILTGVGRIVWGHPLKATEKKYQEDGPGHRKGDTVRKEDGSPVMQWVFGVAFPKAEFLASIWPAMEAEARTGYPNGFPQRFSFKYKDGDGVDSEGKSFADREGHAGCYILTVSTEAFCPPCYAFENGQYRQMTADEIKTGDYVALKLILKVNVATGTRTPSLYVNPQAIQFVGYGKQIISGGVNPNEAFGGRQFALPPGASATPINSAPAGVVMPGQPPQGYAPQPMPGQAPQQPGYAPAPQGYAAPPPQGFQQPGMQPQPGYAPPPMPGQPMPGQMPPPAPDFVTQAGQQPGYAPAPQGYAPPPMPGQPQPGYAPPQGFQQPGMQPQPGYAPPQGYAPPPMPGGYQPPR